MREPPTPSPSGPNSPLLVIAVILALIGGFLWLPRSQGHVATLMQPAVPPNTSDLTVPLPQSPYPPSDAWAEWLAPESVCPGGEDASRPAASQAATATCLLNYARAKEGLPPLPRTPALDAGSGQKAEDILICNDFDHYACHKEPDADARALGLTDSMFGENIYWGPEYYAPPRVAVDGWLNSEHHRENLFDPRWTAQGVAVLPVNSFRDSPGEIWVNEFSAP